jgi:capsid protein
MVTHRTIPTWKRWLAKRLGIRAETINSNSSWKAKFFGSIFGVGGYDSTNRTRKVADPLPEPDGDGNAFLVADLKRLTRQLRHLERNNASVRAATNGLRADVVGTGADIIPNTGNPELDRALRIEWTQQSQSLGVNGEGLQVLQNIWCNEFALSGNCLGRIVSDPAKASTGSIPLSVLMLEVDWLSDTSAPMPAGHSFVLGVELDQLCRIVAIHLRNPDLSVGGQVERVPIEQMIYCFHKKRPTQCIGEPHFAAIVERSTQRGRLINAELKSAMNASNYSTYLKSQFHEEPVDDGDEDPAGNKQYLTDVPLGIHANLAPGDDLGVIQTTRPNTDVSLFAGDLNKDLAAAAGISKVWLDRDGSAYNFANSRFDQIRSIQLIKPIQEWFFQGTIGKIYQTMVPFMMAKLGIEMPSDPAKRAQAMAYRVNPDVPTELDEAASAKAFAAGWERGIVTHEEYLGTRGKDWRVVQEQQLTEKTEAAMAEVRRIQRIQEAVNKANVETPGLNLQWAQIATIDGAASAPGAYLTAATGNQTSVDQSGNKPNSDSDDEDKDDSPADEARSRVMLLTDERGNLLGVKHA